MNKTFKNICLLMCITYIAAAMIISPHSAVAAAKTALTLCANVVIPSLFPFIFCANMFIALGAAYYARRYLSKIMHPLFGVSGAGAAAFFLGIISGYPVGAVCAAELYSKGECTKSEAERLAAFCNNSGPMFVIGAVGVQMLGNRQIGVLLYLVHILSAVITGVIIKFIFAKKDNTRIKNSRTLPPSPDGSSLKNTAADIGAAVSKSVETVLMICGFVVIFAVLTSAIPDSGIKPYIYSFLEITGGLAQINTVCGGKTLLTAAAAIISFSGISVFAQVSAVLTKAELSSLPYLTGKIIQAAVSAALMLFAAAVNGGIAPVFNPAHNSDTAALTVLAAAPIKVFSASVRTLAAGLTIMICLCLSAKAAERIKTYILK